MRKLMHFLLLSALLLALPAVAAAQDAADMMQYQHEFGTSDCEVYHMEKVDVSDFMDRLYNVLTDPAMLGRYDQVKSVAEYLKMTGMFDYQGWEMSYMYTGDDMYFRGHDSFAGIDPGSYYGRVLGLENRVPVSAEYVSNDYMFYMAMNNVTDMLMIQLEELYGSEEMAGMMDSMGSDMSLEDMQMGMEMIKGLGIDKMLNAAFTGEVGLVLYRIPSLYDMAADDVDMADLDAAVILGIKNRAQIESLLETYSADMGFTAEDKGDGWTYYTTPMADDMGLMMNNEVAIITSKLSKTRTRMITAFNREVDPCNMYLSLNLYQINDQLADPLVNIAKYELGPEVNLPEDEMAYLLDLPMAYELGSLDMTVKYENEGVTAYGMMPKAAMTYAAYYAGLVICGLAQSGDFEPGDIELDL